MFYLPDLLFHVIGLS
ncbi:hypothetical protein ACXJY6_16465 [Vibrio sp. RC27]